MTDRKTLLKLFEEITDKAVEIMRGKNTDYATQTDSLANFRASEVLNVDPRKALLIRMLDKIKRQVNYIEKGTLSVDSAEDDIIDLINYSVLLHALNIEQQPYENLIKDVEYVTREEINEEFPNYPWKEKVEAKMKENGIDFAYDELEYKYTEGDRVLIIDDTSGHFFEKWEIVTLENKKHGGWNAYNKLGDYWIVYEEDVKPLEQKETGRTFGV